MGIGLITFILFGTMLALLATGLPICFVLGGCAAIFTMLLWGPHALYFLVAVAFRYMTNDILIAVPMFLLMGGVLQHSKIAEESFDMIYKWVGGIKGGLAAGVVLISTVFAAIVGISSAATIAMSLISIPVMRSYGYDKRLCAGCVMAGGVLGIVIPPSIPFILYATVTRESVGQLFFGGLIPGVLCAFYYCVMILLRCYLKPTLAPAVPLEKRPNFKEKLISAKGAIAPLGLVATVLGGIYSGSVTPTEASCIGALGAFLIAFFQRRLNWGILKAILYQTTRACCLVFFIVIGAMMFNNLYTSLGASQMVIKVVTSAGLNRWTVVIIMMVSLFVLGMVMDDYAIVMICAPLYAPIVKALGFDPIWFGIVFILNMQLAFLTPPFGYNLFYLRATAPKDFTIGDIYRGAYWFIPLQALGLITVLIFPELATWLPSKIFLK